MIGLGVATYTLIEKWEVTSDEKRSKLIPIVTIATMMSSLAVACSNQSAAPADNSKAPQGSTSTTAPAATATTYPIKTDKTLTYWAEINGNTVGIKSALGDMPFFQEWQKKTGVPLKFSSPVVNQAKEGLNVLLASGELPDMIEYNWLDFPGGPEKAIKDGYILKLNDLIDKNAPNLKKYLKEHPDVDKMVKTDNGNYFAFPFIRGDEYLKVFQGPIVRKDWLDELGLPVPTTIDEWYTVLKAFKEKKGAAAPLSFFSVPRPLEQIYNGAFIGAFGINRLFYSDNGQIKFGPAQPEYKEFLATFRKWYAEGLIDKNIATVDSKTLDANLASNATGATIGNTGGGIGKWMPILTAKDPKANLVAAPYPVLKKEIRRVSVKKTLPSLQAEWLLSQPIPKTRISPPSCLTMATVTKDICSLTSVPKASATRWRTAIRNIRIC